MFMLSLRAARRSFFAVCLAALTSSVPQIAYSDESSRTLSLSATGEIAAKPDVVFVNTGVQTEAKTAKAALDQNSAAMEKVLTALKSSGLKSEDIQTVGFSVNPKYHRYDRNSAAEIVGYTAINTVHVKVKDIPRLGEILDQLVTLGSNKINGIQFGFEDPTPLLDKAREQAFKNAKRKALLYAKASGEELGEVQSIQEGSFQLPRSAPVRRSANFSAEQAVPIEAGQHTLRVSINVTWTLDD